MRKALAVYRKELRQIARDRRTLLILVFVPAFFLLLYGYALNWDIRHIALAVQDRDGTPESRALVSAFVNSSYFDRAADAYSPAALDRLLDTNEARAVLVIPEGFARDLIRGLSPQVQVIVSGDNANTATTVMGYATNIVRSAGASADTLRAAPRAPAVTVEPRIWYNPELRSTLFLVPGLIAYIIDDHRRDLDGGVNRPREGGRNDRAGAHGADRDVLVRGRQEHPLFLDFTGVGGTDHPGRDAAVRPAHARQLAVAAGGALAVHRRRARDRPADLDRGRDATSGVPGSRCSPRSCRR